MFLELTQDPRLRELIRRHDLRTEILPASRDRAATLVPNMEVSHHSGEVRLVVDHSYFTGNRTLFFLPDNRLIAAIRDAVNTAIIERQGRAFGMLASVNADVINSLDEGEIVQNVLREVMRVIPQSDGGVFRLFDEDSGFLVPVSQEGLPDEYRNYLQLPNESVSGVVFTSSTPMILNSQAEIIAAHVVMRRKTSSSCSAAGSPTR